MAKALAQKKEARKRYKLKRKLKAALVGESPRTDGERRGRAAAKARKKKAKAAARASQASDSSSTTIPNSDMTRT